MSEITACIIVRDEEDNLPACLAALSPWVAEVCVVDTGSNDRTVEIAEEFGARLVHFQWSGDFSAARNACLDMASHDWVLCVNADERLQASSGPALKRATLDVDAAAPMAWLVYQDSLLLNGRKKPLLLPRLFRNDRRIRYVRPVHECVMESLREIGHGALKPCDVHLEHTGYLPGVASKRGRSRPSQVILREMVLAYPDDLFARFNLARSQRDPKARFDAFSAAATLADRVGRQDCAQYPFLSLLYDGWIGCLIGRGKLTEAMTVAARAAAKLPRAPEIRWRQGDVAARVGDAEAAEPYLKDCLTPHHATQVYGSDPQIRGLLPARRLAEAALASDAFDDAIHWANRAAHFDGSDAEVRCTILRSMIAKGSVGPALRMLTNLLNDAGKHPAVRLLAGELAWQQGEPDAAVDLWETGAGDCDAGQRCRAHLTIAALVRPDFTSARDLLDALVVRDLPTAGIHAVATIVLREPYEREEAFEPGRLRAVVADILRDLVNRNARAALSAFRAQAEQYTDQIPGVDSLLERSPGRKSGVPR
ncbi:MAG: hypothetical protein ACI9OJ_005155 [Myxococcota bacterium]|jgi:hypothetical protein